MRTLNSKCFHLLHCKVWELFVQVIWLELIIDLFHELGSRLSLLDSKISEMLVQAHTLKYVESWWLRFSCLRSKLTI
jgi:hypothetical protein